MVKLPFLKYFCQMAKTRPYKVEFIVSIIFTNEFLQKYYFEKITLKNLIVVKKLKVGKKLTYQATYLKGLSKDCKN